MKLHIYENSLPQFTYILDISVLSWAPKIKLLTEEDLIFVEQGSVQFIIDDTAFLLHENDYVLAEPGQTVIAKKLSEQTVAYVIHFKAKHSAQNKEPSEKMFSDHLLIIPQTGNCDKSNVKTFIKLIIDGQKYKRYGYRDELNAHIYSLLIELQRIYYSCMKMELLPVNYTVGTHYYKKIIQYLNDNYAQKITAKEIENFIFLNYNYINRIFKQICGKTIMEALNDIRFSLAAEMLNDKELTVKDIAERCGFEDFHYFSRRFKKYYGCSPKSFHNL